MAFKFNSKDDTTTLHPTIVEFVPRYVANRRDDYQDLKTGIKTRNFDLVRDYCHKVIGTAKSYHFFQLDEITKVLQDYAREGDIAGIESLMPDYDIYINSLFSKYLSESGS